MIHGQHPTQPLPPSMPDSGIYLARRLREGWGRPGDLPWDSAGLLTAFTFPWTGREPPETGFRALWNEEFLFFRFDVTDADVVLGEGADSKEKVMGSDRAEIFFSTGPELNPYYGIEMDPRGETLQYEARYHRRINWAWACEGLIVDASLTASGYRIEGGIPMSTLGKLNCLHSDGEGRFLRAGLYRAEFSHAPDGGAVVEDWMSWVRPEVPEPDFHVPSSFGIVRLVE